MSQDNTRRTLLKGTAGILATGIFPAVHADEKVTLRYLGTAVNQGQGDRRQVQGRHRYRRSSTWRVSTPTT